MPLLPPPRALPWPRRRTLLASAAATVLPAGCSAGSADSGGTGGGPSVSERARARAARDSRELVERYDAVIAAHPALADRLRPLRAETAAHAKAFGDGAAGPSPASPAARSPSSSAPSSARSADASASPAVPADEKGALAALATAERALADRRAKALLGVEGELARLMASVAAAGAAHAYLLTEGGK
ncbi:hypothetical protein ABZX30_34595 [Streptomyces sp. NPDC004542]|uniref:hypothetical protein n=1 Tax=Streptomyces sp. NPDC004542 TaxID=3154281 RepID=UPI00339F2E44